MDRRAVLCGIAWWAGGLALTSSKAHADMPWSRYLALREQAPEVLQVTIMSVSEMTKDEEVQVGQYKYRQRTTDVVARARVNSILRSASKVAPGSAIEIRYQIIIKDTGFPSVWPPRLLKANESLKVYLKKTGDVYSLAAMKASFES